MKPECSIVKDLLPLYTEDLVSPETAEYVAAHLESCPTCRAELDALKSDEDLPKIEKEASAPTEQAKPFKRMMKKINKRFYGLSYSLIIFFIFLGFGWTEGEMLMYNSLIMPIVGVFGYCVFNWKAIYKVPILLLLIDVFVCLFKLIEIDLYSALMWTLIYSGFVYVGIAIAFLLHFALGKEKTK